MDLCNEESVCAMFATLERETQEGLYDSFTDDDFKILNEKIIRFFLRIKFNNEKMEKFDKEHPFGTKINFLPKHTTGSLDFSEPRGEMEHNSENESTTTVSSEWDFKFNVDDEIMPMVVNEIVYEESLNSMGIALDYDRENEIMFLSGIPQRAFLLNIGKDIGINHLFNEEDLEPHQIIESMLEEIKGSSFYKNIESILNSMSDNNREYFKNTKNHYGQEIGHEEYNSLASRILKAMELSLEVAQRNLTMFKTEEVFNSISETKDSPISINNEPFVGKFVNKSIYIERVANLFKEKLSDLYIKAIRDSFIDEDNKISTKDIEGYSELVRMVDTHLSSIVSLSKQAIREGLNFAQDKEDDFIISALNESQKGGSLRVTQALARKFEITNLEILKNQTSSNSSNGDLKFSFDVIHQGKRGQPIPLIPTHQKNTITKKSVLPFIEGLKKDPMKKETIPLNPKSMTHTLDLKKKKSSLKINNFSKEDSMVRKNEYKNNSFSRYHTVGEDYWGNKGKNKTKGILVIDEADLGIDGKGGMGLRALSKISPFKILVTATPISGYAESIVPLLAYNGKMSLSAIEQNKIEIAKQCGVREIRGKMLQKIFYGLTNKKVNNSFKKMFEGYKETMSLKKKSGSNVSAQISKATRELLIVLIEEDIVERTFAEDLDLTTKEPSSIKALFDTMIKVGKKVKGVPFDTLADIALDSSLSLTKAIPELTNAGMYAKTSSGTAGAGASLSIATRENLTGIKETVDVMDDIQHNNNFKGGAKRKGLSLQNFAEGNRGGVRIAQLAVKEYASSFFLYSVAGYLRDNFRYFVKNFTENSKTKQNKMQKEQMQKLTLLANERGIFEDQDVPLTEQQVMTLFKDKTSKSEDALESVFMEYLDVNGKISESSTFRGMEDNKIALFKLLLEMYDTFARETLPSLNIHFEEEVKTVENIFLEIDGISFDMTKSNFNYLESFVSLDSELLTSEVTDSLENGFPSGFVFSVNVDLCPSDLKHIIVDDNKGKGLLPFRINLKRQEEDLVFDTVGTLGYKNVLKDLVDDKKSVTLVSTRTAGTLFNMLNTIDVIVKSRVRTESENEVMLVLCEPQGKNDSFNFKELINKIDKKLLSDNNIKLELVKRPMLDAAIKRHRGNSDSEPNAKQTFVFSASKSASRGISMARQDVLMITGGETSGSTYSQLKDRQFSPKRHHAILHTKNGGDDGVFSMPSIEAKEDFMSRLFGNEMNPSSELISEVLTEYISRICTGEEGHQMNLDLAYEIMELTKLSESKLFNKTSSVAIAENAGKKGDVIHELMSGNTIERDEAEKIDYNTSLVEYSSAYKSPKYRTEKLENIQNTFSSQKEITSEKNRGVTQIIRAI